MRYGSVCSGIEAASLAWEPLGWQPAWFAEIEPFPSKVLAHRWPLVANLGDMCKLPDYLRGGLIEAPDVLVGGTPCQAFSVAGLRQGLIDPRGALTIKYVEVANAIDEQRPDSPCITVWENVPGVLSDKSNAFGCFLGCIVGEDCALEPPGGKWSNAGIVHGPQRSAAWRILDAQYFGVAQRRRRVFVVASAREGFDPAAVLFECQGVRRDTAPSREKGQGFTLDVAPGLRAQSQCSHRLDSEAYVAIGIGEGTGFGVGEDGDPQFTLQAAHSHAVAFGGDIARTLSTRHDSSPCADRGMDVVATNMQVRRLTPTECERLQGMPDQHTAIPGAADGPRYKAIGNSKAVPVVTWLGRRIQGVLK